jgi:hypothetical protein
MSTLTTTPVLTNGCRWNQSALTHLFAKMKLIPLYRRQKPSGIMILCWPKFIQDKWYFIFWERSCAATGSSGSLVRWSGPESVIDNRRKHVYLASKQSFLADFILTGKFDWIRSAPDAEVSGDRSPAPHAPPPEPTVSLPQCILQSVWVPQNDPKPQSSRLRQCPLQIPSNYSWPGCRKCWENPTVLPTVLGATYPMCTFSHMIADSRIFWGAFTIERFSGTKLFPSMRLMHNILNVSLEGIGGAAFTFW